MTDEALNAEQEQAPSEHMLPQSKVDEIVGRRAQEAAERARRDAEQKYQAELEKIRAEAKARDESEAKPSNGHAYDEEALLAKAQERFEENIRRQEEARRREAEIAECNRVQRAYEDRVAEAKAKYEDFDQVMEDVDATTYPFLTLLSSDLDNQADVMYELAKNLKLGEFNRDCKENWKEAQKKLRRMSDSIKRNQDSVDNAKKTSTNAPVSRMQPSNLTGSNGNPSISDLRRQPWLRG